MPQNSLDVNDLEALVVNIQIPEIDSKIITTDEKLSIAIDGDTVEIIRVSVDITLPGSCCRHNFVVYETRDFELCSCLEMHIRIPW